MTVWIGAAAVRRHTPRQRAACHCHCPPRGAIDARPATYVAVRQIALNGEMLAGQPQTTDGQTVQQGTLLPGMPTVSDANKTF